MSEHDNPLTQPAIVRDGLSDRLIGWIHGLVGLFITAIIVLVALPLVLIPVRRWTLPISNRTANIWSGTLTRLFGIRVDGPSRKEMTARTPCIFVSNHTSLLDLPILGTKLPGNVICLGKKELLKVPFWGVFFWWSGHLLVDRSNRAKWQQTMAEYERLIAEDRWSGLVFPEGTRSPDGQLRELKKGVFHMAINTRMPIQPVLVEGAAGLLPKGSLRVHPGHVKIRLLDRVETDDWNVENVDSYKQQLEQMYLQALGQQKVLPSARRNKHKE